jgi:sulfite dehydrogenase (cytochrome) subunit B
MNPLKLLAAMAAAAVGVIAVADAADPKFTLPPDTTKLKPGPGVEIAMTQCQLCHSMDYITTQPTLSRTAWAATLTKMQQRYGAPLATNQVPALVNYLTKQYGKE